MFCLTGSDIWQISQFNLGFENSQVLADILFNY